MNVLLGVVVSTGLVAYQGKQYFHPVIDSVVAGKPAALAGMLPGDSIVEVDGRAITRWDQATVAISDAPGKPITLTVARGTERVALVMTPEAAEVATAAGDKVTVGRIGVGVRGPAIREPVTMREAVVGGARVSWNMATLVWKILGNLFKGTVPVSQLGGPLEIARSSVAAAQEGAESLWMLIALLSMNLAVLNLLPIPLLDGGQVLLQVTDNLWRRVKGTALPDVVKEWYARIGLVAIGALFITVTFNDIKRWVLSLMGN